MSEQTARPFTATARTPGMPGAWPYALAGVLAAGSIAGVVALAVLAFGDLIGLLDLKQLNAPGTVQIQAGEPGEYAIYALVGRTQQYGPVSYKQWRSPPGVELTVTDGDGTLLALNEGARNLTLTVNDRQYKPLKTFTVAKPGTVTVVAGAPAGSPGETAALAVGRYAGIGGVFCAVLPALGAVAIGVAGCGGALLIFLVTLFRRRRARQRAQAPRADPLPPGGGARPPAPPAG